MESELNHVLSPILDRESFKKQIDLMTRASEIAQAKIDYDSAHSDTVLRSIEIVESFLRKKHRICYGGQAINAYLPKKYKFYDPEYSIPDYDFFTPDQMNDIHQLVRELYKAGFTEISAREGMHEGTIKLYVDYIPVADLTSMDPRMFRMLSKNAHNVSGISYIDPDSLRMLMYLELSRPKGEVTRWPKVYERLMLFNEFVPIGRTRCGKAKGKGMTEEQLEAVLHFVLKQQRVLAGADFVDFYNKVIHDRVDWVLSPNKPIIFYSPDGLVDATQLKEDFQYLDESNKAKLQVTSIPNQGVEMVPSLHILHRGRVPLVFIVEQSACHSYINLPIREGALKNTSCKVASMDTLIALFFSLGFIQHKLVDKKGMMCLANQMVHLSIRARRHPDDFRFPFVSLRCSGHQETMSSLIRAKMKRMTASKKKAIRNVLNQAMTMKAKRKD